MAAVHALVPADWTIDRATKIVTYIGEDHGGTSPSYATVIEIHRWWGTLMDDASHSGDDELDMTTLLISKRDTDNIIRMVNGYSFNSETESEHLYDGSINYDSGGGINQYDGFVNYGNADVQIQIIQDGAVLADDWWNFGGAGLNAASGSGISHRFMLKTIVDGVDIDNLRVLGTTRVFGKTYGEFNVSAAGRGNNTLALVNSTDGNNTTIVGTVAGWTGITNTTEGYALIDINNNGADEEYYSEWNTNQPTRSINDFYERMKWLTMDGSLETIYGLNGELFRGITHQVTFNTPTGTFSAFEAVDWVTGSGQMFAINSTTAGTIMWLQLLKGIAPVATDVITGVSTATATVASVIDREPLISTPFVGASTGTAIDASYGLGMEKLDTSSSDKFRELISNSQVIPPNNVTFDVNGVVVGEDQIEVSPWDGVATDPEGNPAVEVDQLVLDGLLNSPTTTAVSVVAIPSDTPETGWIRIHRVSGAYTDHAYTSWSNATNDFTIASTDFSGDNSNATNNCYIGYLLLEATATTESFTFVYSGSDREFVILVRDGKATPIKQFISSGTMGINGGSISVIRTSDE